MNILPLAIPNLVYTYAIIRAKRGGAGEDIDIGEAHAKSITGCTQGSRRRMCFLRAEHGSEEK